MNLNNNIEQIYIYDRHVYIVYRLEMIEMFKHLKKLYTISNKYT